MDELDPRVIGKSVFLKVKSHLVLMPDQNKSTVGMIRNGICQTFDHHTGGKIPAHCINCDLHTVSQR